VQVAWKHLVHPSQKVTAFHEHFIGLVAMHRNAGSDVAIAPMRCNRDIAPSRLRPWLASRL
jgi:hypothetical protein